MLARVRPNLSLDDLWQASRGGLPQPREALERAFAERFGFPQAVLFPLARSALRALLETLDCHDREVLCPAYICAEVPDAVTLSGNRVGFVDSAAGHFLPGAAEWRAAATREAAMAIVTPLFGYPVEPDCAAELRAAAPDIFILYDEAQSYGAADAGGPQARDADALLLSLGLGKMVTALSGGVLLLRDPVLGRAVRALRDAHCTAAGSGRSLRLAATGAAAWLAFREPVLSPLDWLAGRYGLFDRDRDGGPPGAGPQTEGNILPSVFQARVGLRQLARLDGFLAARREMGGYYQRRLSEAGLQIFPTVAEPTWTRYPVAVADRAAVVTGLHAAGIQVSLFLAYSSALLPAYRWQAAPCENAARWARGMINLPNWYGLQRADAERVVDALLRLRDRDPASVAGPSQVNGS